MATFDTISPFQAADFSFTSRSIQTSGATNGFVYVFICPASFANGDTVHVEMSVSTNGNSGAQSVSARIHALDGAGNWNSAAPLSSAALLTNSTTNFPVGGVAQMDLTLTSALTKGARYALRITPNTTFTASLGFNAVFATNQSFSANSDEYHINGVTLATGTPNLAIGTVTTVIGKRCIRRLAQTTTATTAVTSQIGFKFTLPSGSNYTLNNVYLKGLVLDTAGGTAGTATPRILDTAGSTTIASGTGILQADLRQATSAVGNFTFAFPSGVSLTGGTQYCFVIESNTAKTLQFVEVENTFDAIPTANGTVTGMDVIQRNGTSGVFSTSTVVLSYTAIPIATLDVDIVTSASTTGMLVHPGLSGGIHG
jgi:hypothetical protein